MPMHRANSAKGAGRAPHVKGMEADWFVRNRERQRKRREMAKASKRKNRRK